jgi:hypothetical protein
VTDARSKIRITAGFFGCALLIAAPAGAQTGAPPALRPPSTTVPETTGEPRLRLALAAGRVSISADRVSLAEILAEYSRIGGVRIEAPAGFSAVPVSIELSNVPERQAFETLLRGVAGFVVVPAPVDGRMTSSEFARVVIVPNGGPDSRKAAAVSPANPPPVAPSQPAVAGSFPIAPGVNRLLGPDGQPIPDDQADAPIVQPLPAPAPHAPKRRPGGD